MMGYRKMDVSKWRVGEKCVVRVTRDWKVDVEVDGCDDYSITNLMDFKGIAWGHDVDMVWYEFKRLEKGFESTLRKFKTTETLVEI